MKQKLLLASLIALAVFFLAGPLFPSFRFFVFSPLLVLFILYTPLLTTLWAALGFGILLDLLSSTHMGLNTLNFFLATLLLFRQKKHFIKDNPYNLSLFTILFSAFSTLSYAVLIFLFDRRILFHGKWVLADLFLMPALDGLYAYLCFTLPFALLEKMQKKIQAKKISKSTE